MNEKIKDILFQLGYQANINRLNQWKLLSRVNELAQKFGESPGINVAVSNFQSRISSVQPGAVRGLRRQNLGKVQRRAFAHSPVA